MADLPIQLADPLAPRLAAALDAEGKILRALDALGPVSGRDVAVLGGGPARAAELAALPARVHPVETAPGGALLLGDASVDAIVSWWSAFRGVDPAEIAEADRVLRPGGRLLVVHDYGRDDVSLLRGALPEYGSWSHRNGPFLRAGFRIRVIHCWWTFADVDDARSFLDEAFGPAAGSVVATLRRPRLSYKVAVYHRSRGSDASPRLATAATSGGGRAGDRP